MNHKDISRRTVLKGIAGASLTLPFLDVMADNAPKGSAEAQAPLRFGCLFHPNGVYPKAWDPTGEGSNYKLSESLKPLSSIRDEVSVISNLQNTSSDGSHVRAVMSFLTGVKLKRGSADLTCATSMDQLMAQKLGHKTRIASLELGTEPPRGGTAAGAPIAFASSVSWSSPTTKVPVEINPRLVFDRMFLDSATQKRRAYENRYLVDRVLSRVKQLRNTVGREDRNKVDEYIESVHSVEKRIENALNPKQSAWKPKTRPRLVRPAAQIPDSRPEHFKLMLDLMVLAFQTDSTRVCTFMTAHGFSRKSYAFLDGVSADHHTVSHHKEQKHLVDQYKRVSEWHIEQYVYMLEKMRNIDEGGRSLLDNSMILYGGSLKDGNGHKVNSLPILLAGKGQGKLNPGRHIVCDPKTPHANLHLTLLQKMGIEQESFGVSNGTISNL